MRSHGVRFQPALGGTLHLGRTNAFFLGGGKALLNAYYHAAERRGVRVFYNAEVTGLNFSADAFESGEVQVNGEAAEFRGRSLVVAGEHGPQTRYRLLETIRQYGEQRLNETGQTERWRARHASYYASLLSKVRDHAHDPDQEGRARETAH